MKDKIWEVEYRETKVRAINKLSFFPPKTTEIIEVNAKVVKESKGGFFRPYARIRVVTIIDGRDTDIEVIIGLKKRKIGTGCHIYINQELVGGDINIELEYPNQKKVDELLRKGFLSYFTKIGILKYGLPFAFMMSAPALFQRPEIGTVISNFIFHLLLFSFVISLYNWYALKSSNKNTPLQ